MIFTIDADNNIMYATPEEATAAVAQGAQVFSNPKQLDQLAETWPGGRLVEVWNGFAGVAPFGDLKPVKKFENRQIAVARIWKAVQKLAPPPDEAHDAAAKPADPPAKPKARGRKAAKQPKAAREAKATPRQGTAKATVIEMISRKGGATLQEVMKATGWQAHTVRGFISTLPKKGGPEITSTRRESDKARVYEVAQ